MLRLLLFLLLTVLPGCIEQEEPVGGKEAPVVTVVEKSLKISSVLQQPELYLEQQVTLYGQVSPGLAFQFVNEQPYQLSDETGSIWVITTATAPAAGQALRVRGRIISPYQIKGHSYALVLLEEERLP